jgi:hypothetical protein
VSNNIRIQYVLVKSDQNNMYLRQQHGYDPAVLLLSWVNPGATLKNIFLRCDIDNRGHLPDGVTPVPHVPNIMGPVLQFEKLAQHVTLSGLDISGELQFAGNPAYPSIFSDGVDPKDPVQTAFHSGTDTQENISFHDIKLSADVRIPLLAEPRIRKPTISGGHILWTSKA